MSADKVQVQTATAAGCFCFCSIGMLYFNKIAVGAFPLECSLVALQMAFAAVILLVGGWQSLHVGSMKDVLRWCMVVPFFTGMLLSSILALKHASMSLVITLRALSPLGSLLVERFYPDPLRVSTGVVMSIVVMGLGGTLYCSQLDHSHLRGIFWVILNAIIAVCDRLLQRLMLSKDQDPVDLSKTTCTLINNGFGLVPVMIAAYCMGEFSEVPHVVAQLTLFHKVVIALTCVIGLGISYCGIWAQSLISATSFLVMTNANKFVIIGIEAFGLHTKVLSPIQTVGASVTLIGACLYAQARKELEAKAEEKQPILPVQSNAEKA